MLAVIALRDEAYTITVRDALEEAMGGDVSVGAVGTTMNRLEEKGFLVSSLSSSVPVRGGRRKRLYRATVEGQAALIQNERIRGALNGNGHAREAVA